MSPSTKTLLEQVQSWPSEDQEELAQVAREIASRRTGVYCLSDEERAAIQEGAHAADNDMFASDDEMNEFFGLHRNA